MLCPWLSLNLRYRTHILLDSITLEILWGESYISIYTLANSFMRFYYPRLLSCVVAIKLVVMLGSATSFLAPGKDSYFIFGLSSSSYLFHFPWFLPLPPLSMEQLSLHQLSSPNNKFYERSPSDPIRTSSYELSSGFIALVQKNSFSGKDSENSYHNLREF